MHLLPSPSSPGGQGPQVAPVSGAGLSEHVTPSKQDVSKHASKFKSQNWPV